MFSLKVVLFVAALMFALVYSSPLHGDLDEAATGEHHERVEIKVFRGPSEHEGYDHFAPWAYRFKQPADE